MPAWQLFVRPLIICVILAAFGATLCSAAQEPRATLRVSVVDETGRVVEAARILLVRAEPPLSRRCETDHAGSCTLANLPQGTWRLEVQKENFYAFRLAEVRVGETDNIEVTLNHVQEFSESVEVVASPPAVDPAATSVTETLDTRAIVTLPYLTTRDIRTALPLLTGVLPGLGGQVFVNGSAATQLYQQLDDFNITEPATGLIVLRVSTDAVRSVEVEGSRSSAEYGKGSAGVLTLNTGMGDDRFRFLATDFIPSLQSRNGIHLNNWTPRAAFSGPLRKGKAWFFLAPEGELGYDIVQELPAGQNSSILGRFGQLARAQVNLAPGNILTTGFLANWLHLDHAGLSPLDPQETTLEITQQAEHFTVKDQAYFTGGMLFEAGFGATWFRDAQSPLGTAPYVIRPDGNSGNFFRAANGHSRRYQWLANLYLRPAHWHGRHEIKFGGDWDLVAYRQFYDRRPVTILREDDTLARQATFSGTARFDKNNLEASGFAQDRWSLSDRLLIEFGARFDWDQFLDGVSFSPRVASTFLLTRDGKTKLSAGVGLFRDATNLELLTRPLAGARSDTFFAADGVTPLGAPVPSSFALGVNSLTRPRVLNWSLGLEHLFPHETLVRLEFISKRGRDGFAYVPQGAQPSGTFVLENIRRDRYDGLTLSVRHTFRSKYVMFGSYTRSRARSNAVLDFSIDNVLFGPQGGGPLSWDAPNRLLAWGWLPLIKGFQLAYTLDWRSGYAFNVVNQYRELVGAPDSERFPDSFALNLHVERRFTLRRYQFALRGGYNNITDHRNPTSVVNNIDSPNFLTFSGFERRAFVGRIRFLGRK